MGCPPLGRRPLWWMGLGRTRMGMAEACMGLGWTWMGMAQAGMGRGRARMGWTLGRGWMGWPCMGRTWLVLNSRRQRLGVAAPYIKG